MDIASLRSLSDLLNGREEYAEMRAFVRATVERAVRGKERMVLGERDRVLHSLIANFLDLKGYKMTAKMMKMEMSSNYIQHPEHLVEHNLEHLMKPLKIVGNVPTLNEKLQKSGKIVNGDPFSLKIGEKENRRGAIRINALSDEQFVNSLERREFWQKAQNETKKAHELESDSDDSSEDSSSSEESTSSGNSGNSGKSTNSEKLKKRKSKDDEEKSDSDGMEKLSWGPSKLALITDLPLTSSKLTSSDLTPSNLTSSTLTSSTLTSSTLLPSISMNRPVINEVEENAIDKLFEEDAYDLDEFEEDDVKLEDVKLDDVKVDEKKEEEVSEGESIDELEDFDTGLLSSGASDLSF